MSFAFLRTDRFIATAAFAAVAVWGLLAPPAELERAAYDRAQRLAPERRPEGSIVVVAIDAATLEARGPLPWPEARLAELIDKVAMAQPRVIGLALPFHLDEPGALHGELEALKRELETPTDPIVNAPRPDLVPRVDALEAALDPARPLFATLRAAGNVVLALPDQRGDALVSGGGPHAADPAAARHALAGLTPAAPSFLDRLPPPRGSATLEPASGGAAAVSGALADAVDAVGFVADAGVDGARRMAVVRAAPDGALMPSFALAVAALAQDGGLAAVHGALGGDALLGTQALVTDRAGGVLPYFYRGGAAAFTVVSAARLLADPAAAEALRGRIVVVGVTAPGAAHAFSTPVDPALPAALVEAHAISALLLGDAFTAPWWGSIAQLLLVLGLCAALWLRVDRLSARALFASLLGVAVALALLELGLLLGAALWLPLLLVVQALLGATLALAVKHALEGRSATADAARGSADLEVGEMFRTQGQLDKALERLLRCPPGADSHAALYALGLDFERKRQFNKAAVVFERIRAADPRYQDVADRAHRNKTLENTVMLGTMAGTIAPALLTGDGTQKPRLGRYELEREIGKGAMGTVYLGKDPRIGRVVAIKTMPLNAEFEGPELDEMRERFFREAQAAGRLQHPSIVTVYDVGEEHDLAYMAMDLLAGVSLDKHTKPDALLEWDDAFQAVIQVAEALDYAHSQKVVHRDIKPANIIWDPAAKRAKLTDFGVACLIDASKTKTGTVLGSPSYMSPEQVAGMHVDGRSDIFSLGVTMYQLFADELPFRAPMLTALMYKIANEKHPDIRNFNPRLAPCVGAIVNTALQKDPAKRFPTAGQLAEALKMCRKQRPAY
jgi:CHASE2 domain-containing sensor protein/tRNA A-37 threonylcarbamoyl transferase component Bud32